MNVRYYAFSLLLILWMLPVCASGQNLRHADEQALRWTYGFEGEPFASYMRVVNRTAYPMFLAVPLTTWGRALISGDDVDYRLAFGMTVAEGATFASVILLKNIVQRPRPYTTVDGITSRSIGKRTGRIDPYSFPSGHAAISFSLATSIALANPIWYVIAPAYLVASSVSLSRIWHGMHYPSDVMVGAAIGTGISLIVWLLADTLTPPGWRSRSSEVRFEQATPKFHITIPL